MGTPLCLISACLLGLECRHDGSHSLLDTPIMNRLLERYFLIPVCPEQLGGLPTPRSPSQFVEGNGRDLLAGKAHLVNKEGEDVTPFFLKGATETLKLAKLLGIRIAILKEKSPSCGKRLIYRGDMLVNGCGVTAALLEEWGVSILSEYEV